IARRKKETGQLTGAVFPPRPMSFRQTNRLLTRYCRGMRPNRFLEAGCTVCGSLNPITELSPLNDFRAYMGVLEVHGVTRKERFSTNDPIEELRGPVLADGCDMVCVYCESALVKGNIPKTALALHNWLGEVPEQLRNLSYAEGIMIAKVRHNRCVIRVNSGRVRMNANVIMFSQPVVKFFHKLPPSRDEMQEILAFIFTGSSQPTPEEFDRTPLLVRRSKVLAALEWLKLNHEGYSELEISKENLDMYSERNIPVTVDYRRTLADPYDSLPVSARLVDDAGDEHGTDTGGVPL
ncbi:hypothetical protein DFH09DRAFT_851609, partial [Mycena vulgaris]